MIGIVDVEVQCQNPNMPLYPMRAFVSSPTSIRVRKVPKRIGKWAIESVQFVAAYPDGSIKTAQCVLTGGVWVGTVEGTSTSGTSTNGYTIYASGTDENGNAVTGYILGKGDIEILEGDGTITPGEDVAYVHLLEEESQTPKDGDLYPTDDGYEIWQDGEGHALGTNLTDEQIDTLDVDVERRETIVKLQGNITKTFYWTGTVTKQTLADAELYDQTQQTFAAITEIEFGTGVETIDSQLFMGCTTLEKVKFPSSLVEVKNAAFKNCANLWSITFPKCYTNKDGGKWGTGVFEGCTILATVEIPASMKSIPIRTFYGCANLRTVSISNGVEDIGSRAFMGIAQLGYSQIYIPSSVRRIRTMAFANSNISSVVLNEGLEVIDQGVFNGCTNLMEITIPSTALLQDNVFAGCTRLQKIVFKGKSLHDLTDNPMWPFGLTTAQQALVEVFNDRIVDGNGNIIRADRTCKSGATWNWYISGTNRMIGTKTDSYYINEEETQKYVLQYSDSPLGWTCSIYTKSGDDWVLQNSELNNTVTNPSYLCFSTLSTDMAWIPSGEDEILATTTQLATKQDALSEAQIMAIDQDADAILTKYYVQGESQMHTFIASSTLSKSDFAAQGVYDTQTHTWTKNITSIQTGTNVTGLETNLFAAVTTLTYFEGPEVTFEIGGAQAFGGCTGLQTLKLPKIRSLPVNICKNCTALRTLTLPASLISVGRNAFQNCSNLQVCFEEKTLAQVQAMLNYPWGLTTTNITASKTATQDWVEGHNYLTSIPSTYKTYQETVASLSSDGYATTTYAVKNDGGVAKIKKLTERQYEMLVDIDPTTLYVIPEEV